MVTNAGEIPYTAAADEHGRVFLKVVTFAGNVNGTFLLVRKANPCNLTDGRVGLFGRCGCNRNAYAALLRAVVQNGRLALIDLLFSAMLYKLIYCGHFVSSLFYSVSYLGTGALYRAMHISKPPVEYI